MNRHIDKLLIGAHSRRIIRTAYGGAMVIIAALAVHIYSMLPQIRQGNKQIADYFNEKGAVERLERLCSAPSQEKNRDDSRHGILQGWNGVAQWTESLRAAALRYGMEYRYRIDSLVALPEGENRFFKVPLHLTALPADRKFETTMSFIQSILSDTLYSISLEGAEYLGDELGIAHSAFRLYGWMKL